MYTRFEDTQEAVINPWDIVKRRADCPKVAVTCFAHNLIAYAIEKYQARFMIICIQPMVINQFMCAKLKVIVLLCL